MNKLENKKASPRENLAKLINKDRDIFPDPIIRISYAEETAEERKRRLKETKQLKKYLRQFRFYWRRRQIT